MTDHVEPNELKPMGWGESLLYFGIPAIIVFISFHYGMPTFKNRGLLAYDAYLLAILLPLILMFAASFITLKLEGYPLTWEAAKTRFRLKPMDGNSWLWAVGLLLAGMLIAYGGIAQLSKFLIEQKIMPVPANLPEFMNPLLPADQIAQVYNDATGGLAGNWKPAIFLFIVLFFNIIGEELWWRGVVLPRQELRMGKNTWWIHGLMWACFHIFKWWDVLNLIPITLALSWLTAKKKSTTPGIVMHYIVNGMGLFPFILGALGLLK